MMLREAFRPLANPAYSNPLIEHAIYFLALLASIHEKVDHNAPELLRTQLISELTKFQQDLLFKGIEPEVAQKAHYILCASLDEAVSLASWGRQWSRQNLLYYFYKDKQGGHNFFQILREMGQRPDKYRDLLELISICLAMGFQGRYASDPNGQEKLEHLRQWLGQLIQATKPPVSTDLALHWQGIKTQQRLLQTFSGLGIAIFIVTVLVLIVFLVLRMALDHQAQEILLQ